MYCVKGPNLITSHTSGVCWNHRLWREREENTKKNITINFFINIKLGEVNIYSSHKWATTKWISSMSTQLHSFRANNGNRQQTVLLITRNRSEIKFVYLPIHMLNEYTRADNESVTAPNSKAHPSIFVESDSALATKQTDYILFILHFTRRYSLQLLANAHQLNGLKSSNHSLCWFEIKKKTKSKKLSAKKLMTETKISLR